LTRGVEFITVWSN